MAHTASSIAATAASVSASFWSRGSAFRDATLQDAATWGAAVQDGKGNIQLDVQMQVPAGVELAGTASQDLPHTRHIHWTFPPAFGDGEPQMVEFAGPVTVMVKRIPDVNAAIAKNGFTPETTARLGGFKVPS
jgi:hypothetical protein